MINYIVLISAEIRKIVRPTDVPDSGLVCDLPLPQLFPCAQRAAQVVVRSR